MKKIIMVFVCLMTMVTSVNAHNVHYPTYTEDGITYVKNGTSTYDDEFGGHCEPWDVQKVDKPYDRTIIIPRAITINGEKIRVDGIREGAFATCFSLDSLIISDGISLDGSPNAFKDCKELEYLYYNNSGYGYHHRMSPIKCKTLETANGIGEKPFWEAISGSLEKLIIRDVTFFVGTLRICTKLKTIICYATTAPIVRPSSGNNYSCEDYKFAEYQWSTITLYVPRESLESYYFHSVWGEIDNIYPIDEMETETTAINSLINSAQIAGDVWYSLNGTKVENPTKGVFIKNGKKYILK